MLTGTNMQESMRACNNIANEPRDVEESHIYETVGSMVRSNR